MLGKRLSGNHGRVGWQATSSTTRMPYQTLVIACTASSAVVGDALEGKSSHMTSFLPM